MSRPHFSPRRTQPMRADSYRRIARQLRSYADGLDAAADAQDRHQRQRLTTSLHGLARAARHWWARHRATIDGTLELPIDADAR